MHSQSQSQNALRSNVAVTSAAGHYAAISTESSSRAIKHSVVMSVWIGLYYLYFSTVYLWRVLNVRRTCGWIRPWGSGKGFESAGWSSRTFQSPSDRSRGSSRRCCGHSSSNPSLLWNLVPTNKCQLKGKMSPQHLYKKSCGDTPAPLPLPPPHTQTHTHKHLCCIACRRNRSCQCSSRSQARWGAVPRCCLHQGNWKEPRGSWISEAGTSSPCTWSLQPQSFCCQCQL